MADSITLGSQQITSTSRPYVIAEIGVNHEGSIQKAKELISLAKEGGADAAKFQSYKAGTLASKHSPAYWDTTKEPTLSQHALFSKYDKFGEQDYIALAEYAQKEGIDFLSTPFDDRAVEFLAPLVPYFKIASADLTNFPFLKKIAKKGKPIVLSTGASTLDEIKMAVGVLENAGCESLALLHCILNYPTDNKNAHLGMIKNLQEVFPGKIIGYSDHTLPDEMMSSLITAQLLGAVILEKHFTHDKTMPGNDHYHAMDVTDLKRFRDLSGHVMTLLGKETEKKPIETETISRQNARRSIVLFKDVPAGHIMTAEDLTYKRPGTGVSPEYWDEVVGRKSVRAMEEDHILQWEDLIPSSDA